MGAHLAIGLALALLSAVAINWGYFAQHASAAAMPSLAVRRPIRSLLLLFRSGRWAAGFLAGIAGWGLYVAALALAPLSLVQAAAAGGIGVLAVLVARGTELARLEWAGVGLSLGGLALLGASLGGDASGDRGSWPAIAIWVAASALAAGVAWLCAGALGPGAGLGIAAGLLYGAGDVATKTAVEGGARLAFVPALLACYGLAFVALQLGFQRGGALATAGLASLWTNVLPIAAGMAIFGEPLPGGVRGAARVAAFACVVGGAAALARPEQDLQSAP